MNYDILSYNINCTGGNNIMIQVTNYSHGAPLITLSDNASFEIMRNRKWFSLAKNQRIEILRFGDDTAIAWNETRSHIDYFKHGKIFRCNLISWYSPDTWAKKNINIHQADNSGIA